MGFWDFSHLRICRPSKVAIFTWKMSTVLKRMKNHKSDFSDFYFLSYDLSIKKKVFRSGQIYRKHEDCSKYDFIVPEFFFVRLLVFKIWSILYQKIRFFFMSGGLYPLNPPFSWDKKNCSKITKFSGKIRITLKIIS